MIKFLFPSLVKWLAYDTYITSLISVWYPVFMTLSWIHEKKHMIAEESAEAEKENKKPSTKSSTTTPKKSTPKKSRGKTSRNDDDESPSSKRKAALSVQTSSKKNATSGSGRKSRSAVFPRTSPPTPETPIRRKAASRPMSPAMSIFINEPEQATRYWLRYWIIYALVESLGTFGTLVPVFGSFVAKHPYVLYVCSELKLLFFIWVFFMEKLLGAVVSDEKTLMAQTMPLRLMHDHVAPLILEFEAVVSESVSKETWDTVVVSKVQRILEVFVMLKMFSESNKDWCLHILVEGRPLLLPSISLFMPGFVTSFGVAYAQYLVPSSKSAKALGSGKGKLHTRENEAKEILYLQYWVIHCLVGGFLSYFSSLIWWIPFSTHAIFVMWCYLSFPKSIAQYYGLLETELTAFGLLPGESSMEIHETKTAQVFQAVYSRLPSANDAERDTGSVSGSVGDGAINPSFSIDSQQSTGRSTSMDVDDDSPPPISEEEDVFDPKASTRSRRSNKPSSSRKGRKSVDDEEEEEEWLPTSKSDETSTTDLTSSDSASVTTTNAVATTSVRRSNRQQRKTAAH